MVYTKQTRKAMQLAFHAHEKQVDKTGVPYIFHPIHLAEQCEDERTTTVALLHDVVEDSEWTFEDLKEMGFESEIIEALKLLTHEKGTPYMNYVHKIKENPIATKVKILDLKHNLDITRVPEGEREEFLQKMKEKREKYKEAYTYLSGKIYEERDAIKEDSEKDLTL